MARKPNYAFEKNSRAKAKAAKRELKRRAKLAARTNDAPRERQPDPGAGPPPDEDAAEGSSADAGKVRPDDV